MAFSIDLRERVITAIDNGMRITKASEIFNVCRSVIYDWRKLLKKNNSLAPKSGYQNGHSHKITDWDQFKVFVEKNKHCASPKMRIEWKKLTGVEMSESAMLKALKKVGYTSKKKHLVITKLTKKSEKNT